MPLKSTSETNWAKTVPRDKQAKAPKRSWKARLPLKIADGFLLSSVISGSLRGLMWFGGLLLVFSIMSAMNKALRYTLPPLTVMELILYQLPRLVLFTLPAATLFGAVSAFNEMSASGELTALGVGGMSLRRMLRAPLLLGLLLTIVAFGLQEGLVPWGEGSYQQLVHNGESQIGIQRDFSLIDRNADGQVEKVISAQEFNPATRVLSQPRIQLWNSDGMLTTQITAQSARWDKEQGKWVFKNGTQYIFPQGDKNDPNRLSSPLTSHFRKLVVQTMPKPTTMSSKQISLQEDFDDHNYEMISIAQMWKYRSKQAQFYEAAKNPQSQARITRRTKSLTFGIQDKFATPLMCLAVILLGAPLGVRPQRSGSGFSIGLSLLVLLIYYLVWSAVTNIGKQGLGWPVFMAWLPIGIVTVTGFVLLWRKSR